MATYLEGALKDYLEAGTDVTAIVSTRVYWLLAPDDPMKPYIYFFRVSDPKRPLYFGTTYTTAGQARYQFTCVSDSNLEALSLQDAVVKRLRWVQGEVYSHTMNIITIENVRQRIDPDTMDYLMDVDAMVEYYEP
jgi:hypothetical protein